jgi:hypothetical protein
MINFIVSLLLGMLPEVLYFTLFLSFTKNIKTKRFKLFLLLAIGYILLIMVCRYQLIFYLAYIVYSYLVLKLLYKSEIPDIFIYSAGFLYLTILAFVLYKLFYNYYVIYYIVDRLLLFIPLIILKDKLHHFYKQYLSLWNRSNDKVKIKSITLRNISLLTLNILIVIINLILLIIVGK